eukprot:3980478-Pyramimonas_sp.AAC.2
MRWCRGSTVWHVLSAALMFWRFETALAISCAEVSFSACASIVDCTSISLYPPNITTTFMQVARDCLTVTRGPYLQLMTQNSVKVRWRTRTPLTSLLVFGTEPDRLQTLALSDRPASYELNVHTVTMTCALPDLPMYLLCTVTWMPVSTNRYTPLI